MEEVPVTVSIDGYDLKDKITKFSFIIQSVEQPDIMLEKNTMFFKN